MSTRKKNTTLKGNSSCVNLNIKISFINESKVSFKWIYIVYDLFVGSSVCSDPPPEALEI